MDFPFDRSIPHFPLLRFTYWDCKNLLKILALTSCYERRALSYFIRSRKAHKMALFGTLPFSSGVIKLYRFYRKWGMGDTHKL